MRAQNEPPETAVRLVRGEIDGEATDVPGAFRVREVDAAALAEGRIWPQSRGSILAGLAVGAREGERTLDLCAAPGGKATQLARRGRRRREASRPRPRARGERRQARGDERPRRLCRRARPAGRAPRLRPGARRRARARGSACSTNDLISAGEPSRCPSSSSRCCGRGRRARQARRHDRLFRLHDERRRERDDRRRRPASPSTTWAPSGPRSPPQRPELLLTLPHVHGTGGLLHRAAANLGSRRGRAAATGAGARRARPGHDPPESRRRRRVARTATSSARAGTRAAGGPHAEVVALEAQASAHVARRST